MYAAMLRSGAEERHEFDRFPQHPPRRPGDDDLVTIQARRIVLERTLGEALHPQPAVTFRRGAQATGLTVDRRADTPHVTGVHCPDRVLTAELVIDAAGRKSPIPGWLIRHGARTPVVDSHRTGIAFFCRWYRLRPDAPRRPESTAPGGSTPFAIGGVFPSDNRMFAVYLSVSTGDPTRTALRDAAVFEAVTREFPVAPNGLPCRMIRSARCG